ncbi:MAG: VCBS repeat-containing protein [Candidatus Hydrogenedentes bacterium]|nr:VCBS repeat-containing protein [Candidatus Hydrogenedentota bacterium]
MKGNITAPTVVWKHGIGSIESYLAITPSTETTVVKLPTLANAPVPDYASSDHWGLRPPHGNVAGRDQSIPRDAHVTYADALPDLPGLEKFEVRRTGTVACFAWENGAWSQVWETARQDFGDSVQMLPIAGDFDADGKLDLAFLPWWQLIVLDAATGEQKYACRFTEGRSYGYFGAHDLDGNGTQEFVVMADFAKHIDVLGFRDGKLTLLWQRPIELDISDPRKILRVNPDCVTDVDGDGKKEIIACGYNDRAAAAWAITVHDGMTGDVRAEWTNVFLSGVVDVDSDGAAELLATRCSGNGVPETAGAFILDYRNGHWDTAWEDATCGWQMSEKPLSLNINSGATFANRTALVRSAGDGAFAVFRRAGSTRQKSLVMSRWSESGFAPVYEARGEDIDAIAIGDSGATLARAVYADEPSAHLEVSNASVTVIESRKAPVATAPVAVAYCERSKSRYVIACGHGESIVAFRVDGKELETAWRVSGRGQSISWPQTLGPVVADLRGDGGRQVVYATQSPAGCARIVAREIEGDVVWTHDFAQIPGTPPVWNSGGAILWRAGHFTSRERQDVLVTVRRSMMHSDETALLSGVDGREIWRRNRQKNEMHNRGVGGVPFALADFNDDGLDDPATFYPSQLYTLAGNTGANITFTNTVWPQVGPNPVYFGISIARDLDRDGIAEIVMAGSQMTGAIKRDGSLLWHDAVGTSPNTFAFGDFDGNGKEEIIGIVYPDGVRCYDAMTGSVIWKLAPPTNETPTGAASADINSDGIDEAIVSAGSTLYSIGHDAKNSAGTVLWSLSFPAAIGPPAIAATDASGTASILVTGQDGQIYCVR